MHRAVTVVTCPQADREWARKALCLADCPVWTGPLEFSRVISAVLRRCTRQWPWRCFWFSTGICFRRRFGANNSIVVGCMALRFSCGCGSEALRPAYFLRGKGVRGLTIRAILLSTSHRAVLLVVAGRGSDSAVLLLGGTGYSVEGWRSGSPMTPMDVRMCCDRRSIEEEGNRNGSSRASPVQTFDICSVYLRLEGGFKSLG